MKVQVTVNGEPRHDDIEPRTLLVEYLREALDLTGTKVGCETGECGACVVSLDGVSVKSCMVLAVQAASSEVKTIEGLSGSGQLHPLQASFQEYHAVQCGFCTPGMVMSLVDLLDQQPDPDEAEIRSWLDGNLCRCTGYHNVVKAVQSVIKKPELSAAEPAAAAGN